MTKVVPNYPLTYFYATHTDLPNGTFGAISSEETVGRYSFKEGKTEFVFIPTSELE